MQCFNCGSSNLSLDSGVGLYCKDCKKIQRYGTGRASLFPQLDLYNRVFQIDVFTSYADYRGIVVTPPVIPQNDPARCWRGV